MKTGAAAIASLALLVAVTTGCSSSREDAGSSKRPAIKPPKTTVAPVTISSAPPTVFDEQKIAADIQNSSEARSLGLTGVVCPVGQQVKKGTTFHCTAGATRIQVRVTTDDGKYSWLPMPSEEHGPTLVGAPTLLTHVFDATDTSYGYDSIVAFWIHNPQARSIRLNYRVTLYAGQTPLHVTSGSDEAILPAKRNRPVVWMDSSTPLNTREKPTKATVQLYSATPLTIPSLNDGTVLGNPRPSYSCGNSAECEVTADMKYTGKVPMDLDHVDLLEVDPSNHTKIIGAGRLEAAGDSRLDPGATLPLSGEVIFPTAIDSTTWPNFGEEYVVLYDHG